MYKPENPIAAMALVGLIIFAAGGAINRKAWEASGQDEAPADQVLASFERELDHEPASARRIARESVDHDVLYRMVNAAQWTKDEEMKKAVEYCRQLVRNPRVSDSEKRFRYGPDNKYPCIAQEISSARSME